MGLVDRLGPRFNAAMNEQISVECDFLADAREHYASLLQAKGVCVPVSDTPETVIGKWKNYRHRNPAAKPRHFLRTRALSGSPQAMTFAAALADIERACIAGESLRHRLSKKSRKVKETDPLLYDWGIHHFHLGQNGSRTKELLFAIVFEDAIVAIDIGDHGTFGDTELLEIVHREFPALTRRFILRGVQATLPLTVQERETLRRVGANACVDLADGTVLMPPGGGLNSAGGSAMLLMSTDYVIATITDYQRAVTENAAAVIGAIRQGGGAVETSLPVKLVLRMDAERGWLIQHPPCGVCVRINFDVPGGGKVNPPIQV